MTSLFVCSLCSTYEKITYILNALSRKEEIYSVDGYINIYVYVYKYRYIEINLSVELSDYNKELIIVSYFQPSLSTSVEALGVLCLCFKMKGI